MLLRDFLLSFSLFEQLLIIFIISIFSAFFWYLLVWNLSKRLGIIDRPHLYGHKRSGVPYGVGTFLMLHFISVLFLLFDLEAGRVLVMFIGVSLIGILNFFDDLSTIDHPYAIHLSPTIRLLFQIGIGAFVGITSIKIAYISNIFGGIIPLDDYYFTFSSHIIYTIPLFFTIFWFVLLFNAINWSDGISGMTSGLSVISLCIIAGLSLRLYLTDQTIPSQANSLFVFSILCVVLPAGFLIWWAEWKPRVLMGDSGTMFFAFIIASLSIIAGGKIATVASVLGIYLIDSIYVIFLRIWKGQNPLKGDRSHHLHYRLLQLGLSHTFIRFFVYILAFMFGMLAIFIDTPGKILLLFFITLIVIFVSKIVLLVQNSKGNQ